MIIFLFFFLVPSKVVLVDGEGLTIHFILRKIVISSEDILRIQRVHKIPVVDFGSRGFFGFLGLGPDGSRVWVQDQKNMVAIVTQKRNYIISCERSDDLVGRVAGIIPTATRKEPVV